MRQRGLRLAIVSNAHFIHGLMLEHFGRLGLTERMDVIVTSADVGVRKPHPEIFNRALSQLGVGPEQALFVGDKIPEDIVGPHELGMRAALTHQFRQEEPEGAADQPDVVVNALAELLPWLDERAGAQAPTFGSPR
jgi:putative hydrolase of the HAD superfamily